MIDNEATGSLLPSVARLDPHPRSRIALPPAADAEGLYGPLTNGQRVSLHLAPEIKAGLVALSNALMRNGTLDPGLRQMIIVRVGYLSGSAYEVHQHRSLAERFGIPQEKLDALAYIDPSGLDETEATVIGFVDELVREVRPSDSRLATMLARFTVSQVLEVVMVTGNWMLLARMLETAGVPLDDRTIGETFAGPSAPA